MIQRGIGKELWGTVPLFSIKLNDSEAKQLLRIARNSIRHGLSNGAALEIELNKLPGALHSRSGTFVTLTRNGRLRGCIGAMQSSEPLAQSVADSAYSAAFRDHRFPSLQTDELDSLNIEISILSQMTPLAVDSREELLDVLRPGLDGLLLEDGAYRSTFLPAVWEQLPSPVVFLEHLFSKAGLPPDHWSSTLRLYHYETVCLDEADLSG